MTLVNEMTTYLTGEVHIIHTYYDDISPCLDCRYCWNNSGCAINDGMQEIYQLLNEVDNIILASPIYFSELTGQLLSFASRLQCFYAARRLRKEQEFNLKIKNGVLIISAGGDSKNLAARAIESANIIFRHMNANLIGIASTLCTNEKSAKEDTEALREARKLALELNRLHKFV